MDASLFTERAISKVIQAEAKALPCLFAFLSKAKSGTKIP